MTRKRTRPDAAAMLTELAQVSPVVVAHRMLGAAAPGQWPSAKQQAELHRMVGEKTLAFGSGWLAVGTAMMTAWQGAWLQAWTRPGSAVRWPSASTLWAEALRPMHGAAVANARRLRRAAR